MKIVLGTHGQLDKSTINLANELKKYGYLMILIDSPQKDIVEGAGYITCPNKGYDLGKLHYYINHYIADFTDIDELFYCNDTISPISSFKDMIDDFKKSGDCFRGAVDAYTNHPSAKSNYGYHIQSFCWGVRGKKAMNSLVKHYVETPLIDDKEYVIINFEAGLTRKMQRDGIQTKSYISIDKMMAKYGWFRDKGFSQFDLKIHDPYGEINGSFEYPWTYCQEGLPFIKNTSQQYHFFDSKLLPNLANILFSINSDERFGY